MNHHIAVIVPGGIGRQHYIPSLVQLLSGLSEHYTVHLFPLSFSGLHPALKRDTVIVIPPPKIFQRSVLLSSAFVFYSMFAAKRKNDFRLIHGFWVLSPGYLAVLTGKLLGLRTIITIPGGDIVRISSIRYGGMKTPFHRAVIRWCCRNADAVILLTSYQQKIMEHNAIRARKTLIVPYGVDTGQFSFQPLPVAVPLRLISIGSMNRVKDIFTQVRIVSLLSRTIDCRLTVVGPDILNGEIQTYARAMNVDHLIDWKGQQDHHAIPPLLKNSHLLLNTSLYEAEAVAVMEAFAAGTIVAGSRGGMISDSDTEGRYSADPGDAGAMAEMIVTLINNPEAIEKLRSHNRALAEQKDIRWTVQQYLDIYRQYIMKDGPSSDTGDAGKTIESVPLYS